MYEYIKSSYYGWFVDENKLFSVSSGGAATAFGEYIINEYGGVVFGVVYSSDYKNVEYGIAESVDELEQFKGSKYCESYKKVKIHGEYHSVYSLLSQFLKKDRYVLFIGLGCDVAAVRQYCNAMDLNGEKLFLCELICHGTVHEKVLRDWIQRLENNENSKIVLLNMRNKSTGTLNSCIQIIYDNGRQLFLDFNSTDFGYAFAYALKRSCYSCKFKGENHRGDIVIGDFWGPSQGMDEYNDDKGCSLMLSLTEKGEQLITALKTNLSFCVKRADCTYALNNNANFNQSWEKYNNYEQLYQNINDIGLHKAIIKDEGILRYTIRSSNLANRLKSIIPNTIKKRIKCIIRR